MHSFVHCIETENKPDQCYQWITYILIYKVESYKLYIVFQILAVAGAKIKNTD